MSDATTEIEKAISNLKNEDLQKKMLDSAIIGLSKGSMNYEGDPILPLVTGIIQKHVNKFNNLSAAEKSKILALTESQLASLRHSDKQAKTEFLQAQPKGLDPGLKNVESVKKIYANWGN